MFLVCVQNVRRQIKMIELSVKVDGSIVLDKYHDESVTLQEVGVVLLKLKQIEKSLLEKEFESDYEVKEIK